MDGYNIIFAWDELNKLAKVDLDAARNQLIHILSNYQGVRRCKVILVFDAYKVKGNRGPGGEGQQYFRCLHQAGGDGGHLH